ncbi:hypothetical protein HY230_04005 [Candidatus Acetothermia bacterium]|nr:hypothetical protein [Candidatus Acetothermia bacterium]
MRKVSQFLLIFSSCLVLTSIGFSAYASHGALTTDREPLSSIPDREFSLGQPITFTFSLEFSHGSPDTPAPACAANEVEVEGIRIRKTDGSLITNVLPLPVRCVGPSTPEAQSTLQWDPKDKNDKQAKAGTYVAELITAGTPPHDSLYGIVFKIVKSPDLVLEDLTVTPLPNGHRTITARIANRSSAKARSVLVKILSTGTAPNSQFGCKFTSFFPIEIGSTTFKSLAPQEVQFLSAESPIDACFGAIVDPPTDPNDLLGTIEGTIKESEETNNELPRGCCIGFPSLAAGPDPVLSFSAIGPITPGTVASVPLTISWISSDGIFSGLSSYKIIVSVVGNAQIVSVNFGTLRGKAKIARDKKSATLTASDKNNTITPSTLNAVLAQIAIRATTAGTFSLQLTVLQLIDDFKKPIDFRDRGANFEAQAGSSILLVHSPWLTPAENGQLVRAQVGLSAVQFIAQVSEIDKLRVAVFDLAGQRVFDSGVVEPSILGSVRWELRRLTQRSVASGAYFYVAIAHTKEGKRKSEIGKLLILK